MTEKSIIRKLTIDHFRGIKHLDWNPSPGMNVILGGGDVGKTTVLEAIALLLSPSNSLVLSEAHYWQRDSSREFQIEAVMVLPDSTEVGTQRKFSWPWNWDGHNAVLPTASEDSFDDQPTPDDPVYRVRVRGTADLELFWEIIQPNEETDHFSVAVRRKIGLVQLSADDHNDRDLRLVYGSALDRLFADSALRARIGKRIAEIDLNESLGKKGTETIGSLDKHLKEAALPDDLKLGLTTIQGLSIGALIGLLAAKDGTRLPLASWGTGTRRMAALEIASLIQKKESITIIDEIEQGLEPYRLRKLIKKLLSKPGQTFTTTHSPIAITYAVDSHLWYIDSKGAIGALPYAKIAKQQQRDPETFLAKVAVIAEGKTEVGFLAYLLEKAFGADPLDYGVRVCYGEGNNPMLGLLETLSSAGLLFAGLADDEGCDAGRWRILKQKLGDLLLQWPGGCIEQHVIGAVPDDKLTELLRDEEGDLDGNRLRTLADRLDIQDKQLTSIEQAIADQGKKLRDIIIDAATGNRIGAPPGSEKEWKKHEQHWFKSERGGVELAKVMGATGAWEQICPVVKPLINAILKAVGLPISGKIDL